MWNALASLLSLINGAPALVSAAEGPETVPLRVMTYNVHSCKGRDGEIRPDRIAEVIGAEKPDVVALQEVRVGRVEARRADEQGPGKIPPAVGEAPLPPPSVIAPRRSTDTAGSPVPFTDQPRVIAQALGMYYVFYPLVRLPTEDYGIAVLSRHPMRIVRASNLPTLERREPPERRGAVWVELSLDGRKVQFFNTHLGLNSKERSAQIDALVGPDWLAGGKVDGPFVFCGDLNSWAGQRPYKRLAEIAVDGPLAAGGAKSTFPSLFPLLRIDHVFLPPGARATASRVPKSKLARASSDHLPVVVDVLLPAGR